jgi:hypothetical protein
MFIFRWRGGRVERVSLTSCGLLLVSLHGTEVTTIEGLGSTKEQIHPIQVILQPPAGLWDSHHNRRAGLYNGADPSHPGILSSSLLLVTGTEVNTIEGLGSTKEQIHPIQVILQPPAGQWDRVYHNRRAGFTREHIHLIQLILHPPAGQ